MGYGTDAIKSAKAGLCRCVYDIGYRLLRTENLNLKTPAAACGRGDATALGRRSQFADIFPICVHGMNRAEV